MPPRERNLLRTSGPTPGRTPLRRVVAREQKLYSPNPIRITKASQVVKLLLIEPLGYPEHLDHVAVFLVNAAAQ